MLVAPPRHDAPYRYLGEQRPEADFVDQINRFTIGAEVERGAQIHDVVAFADRPHAAAHAVACFEHCDVEAALLESIGGGQSGQPGADDRNGSSGFAWHAISFLVRWMVTLR